MAHLVKLSALTEELVTALTSYSNCNQPRKYSLLRESSLRSLRSQSYLRTNQFDVQRNLEGLEEKFRVYNEDPLADALSEGLEELKEHNTKWTPEILQLLLQLSDQPVKKSRIEDIVSLKSKEIHVEPVLRWNDLVNEDPELREKGIWRNINYAVESSEDDYTESDTGDSDLTSESVQSTVDGDTSRRANEFMVAANENGLERLRRAQFWTKTIEKPIDKFELFPQTIKQITELQAIREALFMLRGMPTSLFVESDDTLSVDTTYQLQQSSPHSFHMLLSSLAKHGASLIALRRWAESKQDVPLLQSLQDQVLSRVQTIDFSITEIQSRFAAPKDDVVVSLIEVQAQLEQEMQPVHRLAAIISDIEKDPRSQPFKCLELLYDAICMAQSAGNDRDHEYLGRIFLKCFNVYLRPIRIWMEQGELLKNDRIFFVADTDLEVDLVSVWRDRFRLRKTPSGALHAPKFLHWSSSKIFNTGKSVVVLKKLGRFLNPGNRQLSISNTSSVSKATSNNEFDFDMMCSGELLSFAPFPQVFEATLAGWIQSRRETISTTLKNCLFEQCDLSTAMDSLDKIYFMSDGATSTHLAQEIFVRLDAGNSSWNDRFTLTEILQSTVGQLATVSLDDLSAHAVVTSRYNTIAKVCKTVKALAMISVSYHMPWPVQIIIGKESMKTYQGIFTFLLQIRRSAYLLEMRLLHDRANSDSSADERAIYYSLRARLLWFTSSLYHFLTELVIMTNTSKMRQDLGEAEDVDGMIAIHHDYVKQINDQGLLGSRLEPIRKSIITILDLSVKLSAARQTHARAQSSRTFAKNYPASPPKAGLFGKSKRQEPDESDDRSSGEELDDGSVDVSAHDDGAAGMSYVEQLRRLKDHFDQLLKFVISGLRGVARGGSGEPSWEILAAMLESGYFES